MVKIRTEKQNWNVVAVVDSTGSVVERMKYDAFGKVTWSNVNARGWNRTFTGQVLDNETALMLYRNRYYNTVLGRWISRDPIGYQADGNNLYRYVKNKVLLLLDSRGKWGHIAGGCLVGGILTGIGALFTSGNIACAGLSGCIAGAITAAFPNTLGGCIGGAVGALANALCSGQCLNMCNVLSSAVTTIMGCLSGRSASTEDYLVEVVVGAAGFDMGLFMGMCDKIS